MSLFQIFPRIFLLVVGSFRSMQAVSCLLQVVPVITSFLVYTASAGAPYILKRGTNWDKLQPAGTNQNQLQRDGTSIRKSSSSYLQWQVLVLSMNQIQTWGKLTITQTSPYHYCAYGISNQEHELEINGALKFFIQ